ncbi:hypothetical protein EDD16DRAFT_1695107 [Pisolithus croceorrhizus]|nr:hypothetical protein EDD16DRAFT_1695107 [Pisolithus croceorrhizus]
MDILLLPIDANPNYYNLHNVSHQHLSDHLSELVENTLQDLTNSKCIAIGMSNEMDVSVLNLGMIAAYYTLQAFHNYCSENMLKKLKKVYPLSLQGCTKLKGLLEVVSLLAEFEVIPIHWHEDIVLHQIYNHVPIKLNHPGFEAPHFKMFLLLQAHFLCIQLLAGLNTDQVLVLESVTNCCEEAGIEPAYEIMEMEDDKCNALLQINMQQMRDVAMSVNSNLTLDVSYEPVKDKYTANAPISTENPDHDQTIVAPFYPLKKMENWWLAIGQPIMHQLHVMFNIKHVTVSKSCLGHAGSSYNVICDSYIGADHDSSIDPINVAEGQESDSSEDASDEDMGE